MVAKLLIEKTLKRGFKPARVLYTGTGRRYVCDSLHTFGEFKHEGVNNYVHLTEHPLTAMGYARERAVFYGDSPVVLVVDTKKLNGELYYNGEYRARGLNIGSFFPYEFRLNEKARMSEEDCSRVFEMENLIVKTSEKEIRQEVSKFLSATP